ncbi:phosphatidylinositol-4 [Tieghemostelium lacteum]|uniref:phosphatidylinositol 3-kinase n=1 Tax=Tieghemostelium lacteum TaxID=361077 RepID=A0A151Z7Y5_TIELA|nr:phosphatidylinositol-4 [Tieghemostelium lacteum]|eukprot:KYQ90057.1 phosphatidylinositol-4 [Tieghemostelium lacteum]
MSVNQPIISPLSLSNENIKTSSNSTQQQQATPINGLATAATNSSNSGTASSVGNLKKVSDLISTFSHKPMSSIHQQYSPSDLRSTIEKEKSSLPSGSTKYLTTTFEVDSSSSNSTTKKMTTTVSMSASSSPPLTDTNSSPNIQSTQSSNNSNSGNSDKNTMELLDLICNLPTPGLSAPSSSNSTPNKQSPTSQSPSNNISLSKSNPTIATTTATTNTPSTPSTPSNSTAVNSIKKSVSLNTSTDQQQLTPDKSNPVKKQQSMLNVSYIKKVDGGLMMPSSQAGDLSSPRVIRTPNSPNLSSFITPNNIPLVVKKTSTDRSNWKSTIIQGKEDNIKVYFDSIPGKKIIQKFSIDLTPLEIKTKIFEELGQEFISLMDSYELRAVSLNICINNETLPLRRQLLMQACNISRIFPKFQLVPKMNGPDAQLPPPETADSLDLKGHIQAELEIFELIGSSFQRTLESAQDEATSFRRDFARFRLESHNQSPSNTKNNIPQLIYVCSEPLPPVIPVKIVLVVILPGASDGQKITKKIDAAPNQSVREVKQQIFKKFTMIDRIHTRDKTADDFLLKVTGLREYILSMQDLGEINAETKQKFNATAANGDFALIDYDHIRLCIGKQQQITLSFTDNSILKQNIEEKKISFIDKILESTDYDNIFNQDDNDSSGNLAADASSQLTSGNRKNSFIYENNSPPLSRSTSNSSLSQDNSMVPSSMSVFLTSNNTNPNGIPQASANSQHLASSKYLPINKVNRLFRVKVVGLRNLNLQSSEEVRKLLDNNKQQASLFIMIEIYYGGELIANPEYSPIIPINAQTTMTLDNVDFPDWEKDVWTPFNISIRNLPRAARACFTVFLSTINPSEPPPNDEMEEYIQKYSIPVGWSNCQLIDHRGHLRTGPVAFKLWQDGSRANPIGTCVDNLAAKTPFILLIEFESFIKPIVFQQQQQHQQQQQQQQSPSSPSSPQNNTQEQNEAESPSIKSTKLLEPNDAKRLHSLMQSDPLVKLTPEDKKLIYNYRHIYKMKPKSLAKFLMSVNWVETEQMNEAYKQITEWSPLKPVQALELLDAKFPDEFIRTFAINTIDSFTDSEFSDFLLQLTQVLKYEPYHNNRLTKILIQRALSNTSRIGHFFFWFLKSEMHTPEIEERYGLLLEGYLRSCGSHRNDLLKQNQVIKSLYQVAMAVKEKGSASERKKVLLDGLSKIKFPETFQLPLDPRWEAKGLILEKCKYMDSKKLPLWLVFENAEMNANPLTVIFKAGDDLRQDILTLQVLRIMDKFWKNHGMDLRLQPYKCIATGDGIGMIEVVLNANTIGNINKDAGGTGALLEDKTLVNWLKEYNKTEQEFNKAVENFILSCAGYVVATYVMGIGDRHSDNIMITKYGHLFHIDFGHFLGNYKKKYGFKRERAPFIFTPQYMAIVGGKDSQNFKTFVDTCCKAYNILRKNTDLFINLFQLMLSTGIPELQCAEDIDYLRKALAPDLKDEEAAEEFTKNIIIALNTKTVLLNDLFHNWAH